MAINDRMSDMTKFLSILTNEGELIIKPFHSGSVHKTGIAECGKIVSRVNKTLFDYQIGDRVNTSFIRSIFSRRIILTKPGTKQIVLELYHSRLPFLAKVYCKEKVRCLTTLSDEPQPIGSIQQKLAFAKIWYNVYNNKDEHVASLMLRKTHLRGKIHHRILECEIVDNDQKTNIGRIYPFSTDLERSAYRHAAAAKIPQTMKVETKATLLIAALILKSKLN